MERDGIAVSKAGQQSNNKAAFLLGGHSSASQASP
jgi:hypothetical protein